MKNCETTIKTSNILSSHQPAYLPWLGLIHKLWLSDKFIIFDCVEFEKGSFINRNRVMAPNKQPVWLTIPLKKRENSNSLIRDVKIDNSKPWKKKHLSTITHSYSKTPGFKRFFPLLEDFYNDNFNNLAEMGFKSLELFMNLFGFTRPLYFSSTFNLTQKKDKRVLEMCQKINCDSFIFGELGYNYADKDIFLKNGIKPIFQKFIHPKYEQASIKNKQDTTFYSNLSALDFIMLHPNDPLSVFKSNILKNEEHLTVSEGRNCIL